MTFCIKRKWFIGINYILNNMHPRYFYLILFLVHPSLEAFNKNFGGPFDVEFERAEACEDNGTNELTFENYRISRIGRNKVLYNGTITSARPVDESFNAMVHVAVWGNGGWRENYFIKRIENGCAFALKVMPNFAKTVFSTLNVTECPFPAGSYYVKDLVMDIDVKMKSLPYNKYKNKVDLFYKEVKIGCVTSYVEIKPKVVKRKRS